MKILNFISTDATLSMPVTTYEALIQVNLENAVKDERERIIKLLEANLEDWTSGLHLTKNYSVAGLDDLIALIKGEEK